jgi:hypothetical protein
LGDEAYEELWPLVGSLGPVADLLGQIASLNGSGRRVRLPAAGIVPGQTLSIAAPEPERVEPEHVVPEEPAAPAPEEPEQTLDRSLLEDREWLRDQYEVQGKGSIVLSKMLGCSSYQVLKWVRLHGLEVRPKKGAKPAPETGQEADLDPSSRQSGLFPRTFRIKLGQDPERHRVQAGTS